MSLTPPRILIVEDEYVTRLDLKVSLEALGYRVVDTAATAHDAVERSLALRPDLVLMDIKLQGRDDGIGAAARIRQQVDAPIVYLTAFADDATLERARATGAYGYLLKPFQESALKAAVETALERARVERAQSETHLREAVGRLAGGIAHDFNNLLTVILGYCEEAQQPGREDGYRRTALAAIEQAGRRAAALTGQLLAFSRKQVLNQQSVELNALVAGAAARLRRRLGEAIPLHLAPAPEPLTVVGDVVVLEQVLLNLADNARDAMPQGGEWHLQLSEIRRPDQEGRYGRLTVRDSGVGMTEEVRRHIFEPYFTTKERKRGTGLGLAAVFGAVEQHRGHITVTSAVGQGTTFVIDLPLAESASVLPTPVQPDEPRTSAKTILLVEDDVMVRELAASLLASIGCRVLEAGSGQEALAVSARTDGIDLLVSDVIMPGMNGPALYEALLGQRPGLPVLFMSGYTFGALEEMGVLRAGTHLLLKPFPVGELLRLVNERLGTPLTQVGEPAT